MGRESEPEPHLAPEIAEHYGGVSEATRLATGVGRLERAPELMGASAHLIAVGRKT